MNNITIINGNILDSQCQTLVNPINCVGVMGKGLALEFKKRYPKMFDLYKEYCKNGLIQIGNIWLYKNEIDTNWVLNFPTKQHWKQPSKLEYIEQGLEKFIQTYQEKNIQSIAFTLLGAGNGSLDKHIILSLLEQKLSVCDVLVEIYK
jgi:O-acetyl-ADP-ribose deacetylase (regulator of RNase III)